MSASSCASSASARAMTIYSLAATGMLITNKMVMMHAHTPSTLSSVQFVFTAGVTLLLAMLPPNHLSPAKDDVQIRWSRLYPYVQHSLLFVTSIYSNLRALQHSSVQTIIVFRSSCPLLVSVLDWAFLGRELPSRRSLLSLVVIAGSACGYVLIDDAFRMSGLSAYAWCLSYFILISLESVFGKYVTGAVQFDSVWGSVLHNNLAALPLMALLGVLTGEPSELAYNVEWSQSLALSVALSCAISVGIAYSAWSVRQQVSASCFTVLGVANKLLTVLVSNLVFTERSSALGNGLLFVCVVAAALYKQAPLRPPPVDDEAEHDESASLLSLSRHDGGYSIKRRAYDSV